MTTVVDLRGLQWATEPSVIESMLGRRPGLLHVVANAVAQTATVTVDQAVSSLAKLRTSVEQCRYHCRGQAVPAHLCDPMAEPGTATGDNGDTEAQGAKARPPSTPHDAMGHGGHGGETSMDAMVDDMRNRLVAAALFSVPIMLWSPIGRDVLNFSADAPAP